MITNIEVLKHLQNVIATQLNEYLIDNPHIDINNVAIDFPDVDNMRKNVMFYIEPDSEVLEGLTMCSDLSTMETVVYIFAKKEKQDILIEKVFEYYNALYLLLRGNQDLDGYVDFIEPYSMDYYPAVTADKNIVAVEVAIRIQFTKEF